MNTEEAVQVAVDILRGDANDLATLAHEPVWKDLNHRARVAIQREIQRLRDAAQKLTELPVPEEIDPADEPDEYGNTERELRSEDLEWIIKGRKEWEARVASSAAAAAGAPRFGGLSYSVARLDGR